ncbi:MAG: hypothetical protein QG635_349 [Bacteroidota bacterium]|nr:hypothetical protein [Bacteroidota bacterium]
MNEVAVVIVTFNRLGFLKEIIDAVRKQSYRVDKIFVVNNTSTDGTSEWLAEQDDISVITQDNVGSSGGQYTGIKAAYNSGAEWIWVMDDDVVPVENCLEILINIITEDSIITPLRFTPKGLPFTNDTLELNLTNPFRGIIKRVISESDLTNDLIKAEGITFEGPLFNRKLIEKIGLPEKKYFIYGDDTEFMVRALKANFKIFISTKARLNRKLELLDLKKEFGWKHYYIIRNIIAIDVLNSPLHIRLIRPFGYLAAWLLRCRSFKDIKTTFRAFLDGFFYKSENEIF